MKIHITKICSIQISIVGMKQYVIEYSALGYKIIITPTIIADVVPILTFIQVCCIIAYSL